MDVKINDLKNFIQTAHCRTIVEASTKLEISQPALSESIKNLEKACGLVLFYRSRSGIQLTQSGKETLSRAKEIIGRLEEISNKVKETAYYNTHPISVGCHPVIARHFIPKALKIMSAKSQDFRIELKHDLSRHIMNRIQKGEIDIGIVVNPTQATDVVLYKLCDDEVGIWKAKNSKDNLDVIFLDEDLFQTQSILKKWKNKPSNLIQTSDLSLIAACVEQGLGYGVLPANVVKDAGFSLVKVKDTPVYKDEIYLVYRPEFGKTPYEKLFIESFKKREM